MEKILTKFIQDEINQAKYIVKNIEVAANRRISDLQSVLSEIDNLPETSCPICEEKNKDVSHIIERNFGVYWEGSHCGATLHQALQQLEVNSWPMEQFPACERCTTSLVYDIDFLDKDWRHTWDRDLNLPGRKTKSYRILDKHPQIDELIYNPLGYWYVKIANQWYFSKFSHMVW